MLHTLFCSPALVSGCGAKVHPGVWKFFKMLSVICNVVNSYCKRKDIMLESYKLRVQETLGKGEIESGTGLNQELSLTRPGDTRWVLVRNQL